MRDKTSQNWDFRELLLAIAGVAAAALSALFKVEPTGTVTEVSRQSDILQIGNGPHTGAGFEHWKPVELLPGWHEPRPAEIPKPTYIPVISAIGIILLALGVVTSFWVSVAGTILFVLALAQWIGELRHEH